MNTLTSNLDTLYTTTWQLRRKDIVDQLFEATPFFSSISKSRRTESGGTFIEVPLSKSANPTFTYFKKGGTVSINDSDPLTTAKYDWKYAAISIVRDMVDEQKNRGEAAVKKMVTVKLDNARDTMIDEFEQSLFSDGSAFEGDEIDGLGVYVPNSPLTGTVANINRATYSWWRSQYKDMSSRPASVYLRKDMSNMYNTCGKLGKGIKRNPNLIITDQTVYELYEDECAEIQQVHNSTGVGALGFGDLEFRTIPLTWSPSATSGKMFFLNTNYFEWVVDSGYNFEMDDWKGIPNQPKTRVTQIVVAANIVASSLARLGVLFSIAA